MMALRWKDALITLVGLIVFRAVTAPAASYRYAVQLPAGMRTVRGNGYHTSILIPVNRARW
jgi:hypothetical protein